MGMRTLAERVKIKNVISPVDTNGQLQGGNFNFTSMRNYSYFDMMIQVGTHSGDDTAVTLNQAKNVEGNGAKALEFVNYWSQLVGASPQEESDLWQPQTAVSDTFDIAANTNYLIPIKPDSLDVTNNFDCVRFALGLSSAATLIAVQLYMSGGPEGIAGDVRHIPSAAVNRMPNT